jgi:hypothetical protein
MVVDRVELLLLRRLKVLIMVRGLDLKWLLLTGDPFPFFFPLHSSAMTIDSCLTIVPLV